MFIELLFKILNKVLNNRGNVKLQQFKYKSDVFEIFLIFLENPNGNTFHGGVQLFIIVTLPLLHRKRKNTAA